MGRYFLVRAQLDGPQHVRATFWAGTRTQMHTGGRPNLGELCMTPEDWSAFRTLFINNEGSGWARNYVEIEGPK
jgi:hypothetical protein